MPNTLVHNRSRHPRWLDFAHSVAHIFLTMSPSGLIIMASRKPINKTAIIAGKNYKNKSCVTGWREGKTSIIQNPMLRRRNSGSGITSLTPTNNYKRSLAMMSPELLAAVLCAGAALRITMLRNTIKSRSNIKSNASYLVRYWEIDYPSQYWTYKIFTEKKLANDFYNEMKRISTIYGDHKRPEFYMKEK